MLELANITKNYTTGNTKVEALKGVSLKFRESEFVSILGPSGCGKTTLLNIIGGLDRYSSGDLSINGKSTAEFSDKNWDSYRNHSVGFVFQSYNLIPHQTVLSNVELALTLSGVSKSERRKRAVTVLEKVGLGDQLNKKPNQMSGGQMQRVAIARALVNDPEILLADEPTGALDSETSVQVMELLSEIAKDRLVIMVTHNPELADRYSTRIIKLLDGKVIDDTNPCIESQSTGENKKSGKTSMSLPTAFSLSLNNLMTKKARTFMTAFAGSIGIIGIALILSLSSGFQAYISKVEEDTLSSYPIMIEKQSVDMTSMMTAMSENHKGELSHELDAVYSNDIMSTMTNTMVSQVQTNDLAEFKKYIDSNEEIKNYVSAISYRYGVDMNIYKSDYSNGIVQVNPSEVFENMGMGGSAAGTPFAAFSGINVWSEMIDNRTLLESQYDVIAGKWPDNYNEIVLVVDSRNEISDVVLYSLGLKDAEELDKIMGDAMEGIVTETEQSIYQYDDLLGLSYTLLANTDYYQNNDGIWTDMREDEEFMKNALDNGIELTVVGILRPKEEASATSITGSIGYLSSLTDTVIEKINSSEVVAAQRDNKETDIFTGIPFSNGETQTEQNPDNGFDVSSMTPEEQAYFASLSEEEKAALMEMYAKPTVSESTYENNMDILGVTDKENPSAIYIYPVDFSSKSYITDIINDYNEEKTDSGNEEYVITYTDYIGLMLSSVSTIVDTISYVLIAFVAISLVVSSIMIGIITYISVLERTKEIGILRSIGASKKDISRVFNAETILVGFTAGAIGIGVTVLLTIPINMIIYAISGISGVAKLPVIGGIVLVLISMALTWIAGLIPSKIAAKKDPVTALRSE